MSYGCTCIISLCKPTVGGFQSRQCLSYAQSKLRQQVTHHGIYTPQLLRGVNWWQQTVRWLVCW